MFPTIDCSIQFTCQKGTHAASRIGSNTTAKWIVGTIVWFIFFTFGLRDWLCRLDSSCWNWRRHWRQLFISGTGERSRIQIAGILIIVGQCIIRKLAQCWIETITVKLVNVYCFVQCINIIARIVLLGRRIERGQTITGQVNSGRRTATITWICFKEINKKIDDERRERNENKINDRILILGFLIDLNLNTDNHGHLHARHKHKTM